MTDYYITCCCCHEFVNTPSERRVYDQDSDSFLYVCLKCNRELHDCMEDIERCLEIGLIERVPPHILTSAMKTALFNKLKEFDNYGCDAD